MSEQRRFSLEMIVSNLPIGFATLVACVLAVFAAFYFDRETLSKIPEIFDVNIGYDNQLKATANSRAKSTDGLAVTLIDVDNVAVEKWSPVTRTTPRNQIASLIDKLKDKKPKLIFLDFDLSGESADGGDDNLRDVLLKYPQNAPPLLLTRSVEAIHCREGKCESYKCPAPATRAPGEKPKDGEPAADKGPSLYESTAGKANIIWVASVFSADGDGVVRSSRLWEAVCQDGEPVLLPSPALVATALADNDHAGMACLSAFLGSHGKTDLPAGGECKTSWPTNKSAYSELVPFIIGAPSQPRISDWLTTHELRYQRVRASSVLDQQNDELVAPSALADRVLLIGASYGADKFKTPLGVMPGVAVIANAVAVAPVVLDNAPRYILRAIFALGLGIVYISIAKIFRALPAAVIIFGLSYAWFLVTPHINVSAADAVNVISRSLGLLAVFLAIESLLEIAIDAYRGKGFRALMRARHRETEEA
ncbi:MAG: CHASE2 domain-containing protein [Hyphomicrobium sp.]